MTSREQFEDWAANRGMRMSKLEGGKVYVAIATDQAWQVWQASRAAMIPAVRDDKVFRIRSVIKAESDSSGASVK